MRDMLVKMLALCSGRRYRDLLRRRGGVKVCDDMKSLSRRVTSPMGVVAGASVSLRRGSAFHERLTRLP